MNRQTTTIKLSLAPEMTQSNTLQVLLTKLAQKSSYNVFQSKNVRISIYVSKINKRVFSFRLNGLETILILNLESDPRSYETSTQFKALAIDPETITQCSITSRGIEFQEEFSKLILSSLKVETQYIYVNSKRTDTVTVAIKDMFETIDVGYQINVHSNPELTPTELIIECINEDAEALHEEVKRRRAELDKFIGESRIKLQALQVLRNSKYGAC